MPQRFLLDRPLRLVYLGLGVSGCAVKAPVLVPEGTPVASAEQVASWVGQTRPTSGILYRFTWLYQDEQASKGGRGSARIARPDTLRFDFAGSLGIGKGSALVVGDTPIWVEPERSVQDLVPSFPLLWALLGVAMGPGPEDRLSGSEASDRTMWRYARGADTVEYLRISGESATLTAEVRQSGQVTGRSRVTLRADGSPVKAQLTVPSVPAKLEITYYATVPTAAFPPDTWKRPEP